MLAARKLIAAGLIVSLLGTSSCGYFLYPERVGQTEGRIDPTIVILDALGLFIGVIPGVVAFAVDLTTGAIYLPEGERSAIEKHHQTNIVDDLPLKAVNAAELPLVLKQADRKRVARQLSEQLGITVDPNAIEFYRVNQSIQLAMSAIQ